MKKRLSLRHLKSAKIFLSTVKSKTLTAVTASFAFVIALSWNDAIKSGVDQLIAKMGITGSSYILKILAALIITAIAVVGIYLFSRAETKTAENA